MSLNLPTSLCMDDSLSSPYVCPTDELFHYIIFLFLVAAFFYLENFLLYFFCKAGLVVLKSFSFCFSPQSLISPSNLKESLAGWSILGCRFFPFITLNISCLSVLACGFPAEKPADSLMVVPLYVICCFSLVVFSSLSLSLTFVILYIRCLCTSLFGLILYGIPSFLGLMIVSFPTLGKCFQVLSLQISSQALSFVSFWDPYNANICVLAVVPMVS